MKNIVLRLGTGLAVISLSLVPASAITARAGVKTAASNTGTTAKDQAKLQLIINRGNSEISRRLSSLNTLNAKINGAVKLTADDKASLSQEVTDEINSLTDLKTKLDADTDVATAKADAQSIITDYRVYALVTPKVNLIRTADDQQVTEGRLSDLATKLQTRVTSSSPSSLQAALSDMTSKVSAAQAISPGVESAVIALQPSDYNSDHNVLKGYRDQLKTAQNDIQAAVNDAKTIVAGLKTQ